eukprot:7929847-Alexandrium_andersonii.AAC.1
MSGARRRPHNAKLLSPSALGRGMRRPPVRALPGPGRRGIPNLSARSLPPSAVSGPRRSHRGDRPPP